jgi:DNA (cytosine-5)-methyltransferase 1
MALTIEKQSKILIECARESRSVADVLFGKGFALDDLLYVRNRDPRPDPSPFESFESLSTARSNIPAVSFFSGAGGLDLGLKKAGFKTVAAVEFEPVFCQTLRKNHPSMTVFGPPMHAGNVRDLEAVVASLEALGVKPEFEGLFHGGPPCQPFSIAANQRFSKADAAFKRTGFGSEKGTLLMDYVNLIVHFLPRSVLIENVPGLKDIDGGKQLALVFEKLEAAGYWINEPWLLNARDYGVPQDRRRLIIIAHRKGGSVAIPDPKPRVNVAQALFAPVTCLPNHVVRDHRAESLLRYMELDYGQRDHLGRVDRLAPDRPSKTVIAGGLHGGGRSHLHPFIPRTLSPRECARLQTFPDGYEFGGTPARQFTQIGNAVPPLLAYWIGRAIRAGAF